MNLNALMVLFFKEHVPAFRLYLCSCLTKDMLRQFGF